MMLYLMNQDNNTSSKATVINTGSAPTPQANKPFTLDTHFNWSISKIPWVIVIDCETNGFADDYDSDITESENWPRIVSIAWIVMDDEGRKITEHYRVIKQEQPIWPAATRVHGITDEIAEKEGEPLNEVLELLMEEAKNVKVMVAHNIDFDIKVLQAEYHRLGMKVPFKRIRKRCTMKLGAKYCEIPKPYGNGYKWPKLEELADHIYNYGRGEKLAGMHNARTDMLVTAKCFWWLVEYDYAKL
jgi:DNA polymerase III epsilon subunit-like protein